MSISTTGQAVARAYEHACREVDNALQLQMRAAAEGSKPGQTVTMPKRMTGEYFDMANRGVSAARAEALETIAKARKHASGKLVEAPSAEAANYCATLQGRDDLTEREVMAALSKYPNHSAQQAILAAARRSGIHTGMVSEQQADLDALDALESEVQKQFTPFAISEASKGFRGFVGRGFETANPNADIVEAFKAALNA